MCKQDPSDGKERGRWSSEGIWRDASQDAEWTWWNQKGKWCQLCGNPENAQRSRKKQKRNRAPEKDHQQASGIQLNKFKYAFFRRYTFTYSSKRKKVHQFQEEEHAVQRRTERTSCSSFCAFWCGSDQYSYSKEGTCWSRSCQKW